MKKLICFLLVAMLSTMLPMTVWASDSQVVITSSVGSVFPGETFTITAVLNNEQEINLATVVLFYNDSGFEMVGGNCLVKGTALNQVVLDQKVGTLLLPASKVLSGELFTFTFRVKENAPVGEYEIGVKASIGAGKGAYIDARGMILRVGCEHKVDDGWFWDGTHHWQACCVCQERSQLGEHQWKGDGLEKSCLVCGFSLKTGNVDTSVPADTIEPGDTQMPLVPENATEPTETQRPSVLDDATEPGDSQIPSVPEQTEAGGNPSAPVLSDSEESGNQREETGNPQGNSGNQPADGDNADTQPRSRFYLWCGSGVTLTVIAVSCITVFLRKKKKA